MAKFLSVFKKPKAIVVLIILAAGALWAVTFFSKNKLPAYDSIIVSRGELIQEVSVTGKVKPAKSVDLQFEKSGRIARLNVSAGDQVKTGKILAVLDSQEQQAVVLEKEAALESARADREQTVRNYNSSQDPETSTALRTDLENAQVNLENAVTQADDDLEAVYNDNSNIMNEAMVQAESSSTIFKSLRESYFNGADSDDIRVQAAEKIARDELFGSTVYNQPGAKGLTAIANSQKTFGNINAALSQLAVGLGKLKDAFNILQTEIKNNLTVISSTDRDLANTEASTVAVKLTAVSEAIQDAASQKITNNKNIDDAKAKLAVAQAAFPTAEEVTKKQAAVKQAEALLLNAQVQYRKMSIIAPFNGVVTKVNAEPGETAAANQTVVSMISSSGFEMEANVAEADIAKVKVDDLAKVTLDAFGSDVVFEARVTKIDPGETVIEGVATYKTTLNFIKENIGIKSGMTANIDILTAEKSGVMVVPRRAIITKNGDKFVKIVEDDKMVKEVKIETGLVGSDGNVEITSGIREGDEVIISTK